MLHIQVDTIWHLFCSAPFEPRITAWKFPPNVNQIPLRSLWDRCVGKKDDKKLNIIWTLCQNTSGIGGVNRSRWPCHSIVHGSNVVRLGWHTTCQTPRHSIFSFSGTIVKCSIPATSSNRYSNPSSPVAPRQHIALICLEAFTGEFPIQGPDQFQDFWRRCELPGQQHEIWTLSPARTCPVTRDDMFYWIYSRSSIPPWLWVIKHDVLFFRAFASAEPTQNTNAYKRLIHSNPR